MQLPPSLPARCRWSERGPRLAVGILAAVVAVGTFLPWIKTGSRRRTSYGMMGLIDRLEFAPGGPAARAVQSWPLVPTLCVLTMIAAWWPRSRLAGTGGLVIALYVGGVALALNQAPVTVLVGPRIVLPASLLLIVAAVICLVRPTRRAGSRPA